MGAGRVPRGHPAGQSPAASLQGAFKKYEFLPLTPCFSWVNEGRRAASTVLTVSLILRAFESVLELTLGSLRNGTREFVTGGVHFRDAKSTNRSFSRLATEPGLVSAGTHPVSAWRARAGRPRKPLVGVER